MMPLHFCHEIPQFPKYEYILPNSHFVLTQLVYLMKNGTISKLRCYCAQEHHFTPSSTQFLLSQINPICTMNFFLGILYVCNGGWILTVVRAHLSVAGRVNLGFGCLLSRGGSYPSLDNTQLSHLRVTCPGRTEGPSRI